MGHERYPPEWYRLVLNSISEVVIVIDTTAWLEWANAQAEVVLGYKVDAEIGRNVLEWVHPDDLEETARLLSLSLERGYSWPRDVRVRHANGNYITMAVSDLDPLTEARDQYVVTLRHVQPQRLSGAFDAELSAPLAVLHHVGDAVIAVGGDGQVIFRNRSAMELFRFGAMRVMSPLPVGPVLAPLDRWDSAAEEDPFARVARGDKVPRYEARLVFPDGSERAVEVTGEPLVDHNGLPSGGVVAFRDVTELRRQEAELRELALRDALTGLANRTELMAQLRAMLAECLRHGGHVVVMFVDLDRFKDINDSFDHLVGDEVLQATARRLVECAEPNDLVARFGGEEFVVASVLDTADADALARRIVERLREPVSTVAGPLTTSCSVGLTSGGGTTEPEQLLREADTAVYAAKRLGGATVAWYDRSQRERSVHRIRAAKQAQELTDSVHGVRLRQIIDLESGAVVAVRPEIAEINRAGIAAQTAVDRRVSLAFVEHLATVDSKLRASFGEDAPFVMLTLPALVLTQRALVGELEQLLGGDVGMPRHRRVLEVISLDPAHSIDASLLAAYVGSCHCRLVVDDLGVLADALLADQDLALWAVKVRRELVRRLPSARHGDRHTINALTELAVAHGAPLAADRVDAPDQLHLVRQLGTRYAWGDALRMPVTVDELLSGQAF